MNKSCLTLGLLIAILVVAPLSVRKWQADYAVRAQDYSVNASSIEPLRAAGEAQTFLTQEKNISKTFEDNISFYDIPKGLVLNSANISLFEGYTIVDNKTITLNPSLEEQANSPLEREQAVDIANWYVPRIGSGSALLMRENNVHSGNRSLSQYPLNDYSVPLLYQTNLPLRGQIGQMSNLSYSFWIWYNGTTFLDDLRTTVAFGTRNGVKYVAYNGSYSSPTLEDPVYYLPSERNGNSVPSEKWAKVQYKPYEDLQEGFNLTDEEIYSIETVEIRFTNDYGYYLDDIQVNLTGSIDTGVKPRTVTSMNKVYNTTKYEFNQKAITKRGTEIPIPIRKEEGENVLVLNATKVYGRRDLYFGLHTSLTTKFVSGEWKKGKLSYRFEAPSFGRYQFDKVKIEAQKPAAVILSEEGAVHEIEKGHWSYSNGQVIIDDNAFIADYFSKTGSAEEFEVQLAYRSNVRSKVNDKKGNPLGGMTVTLENLDTGGVYASDTGGKGIAHFFDVPSGEYVLTVRGHGLETSRSFTVAPYQSLEITVGTTITAPYVIARSLRYTLAFIPLLALVPAVAVVRVIIGIYTGKPS